MENGTRGGQWKIGLGGRQTEFPKRRRRQSVPYFRNVLRVSKSCDFMILGSVTKFCKLNFAFCKIITIPF